MNRTASLTTAALALGALACSDARPAISVDAAPLAAEPPPTLRETGLYADWATRTVAAANLPFTPQYPLWTDGARKRRWIYLPPGTAIDGARPDAWQFPVGTKLWKEFAFGRRAETRYMVRTSDGWRYATYVWTADEREAVRAPARGARTDVAIAEGLTHAVPGEADCRVCHDHAGAPVLGFSALQLSPDRDPRAVHAEPLAAGAIDLDGLRARGLLRGYPEALRTPRIVARTPEERAALGYLHGNCGSCHRAGSAVASLGMELAYTLERAPAALATTIDQPAQFTLPGASARQPRIAPGHPERSVVLARVRSRAPLVQMPPFGSQRVDDDAARLLASWIAQLAPQRSSTSATSEEKPHD